MLVEQLPAAAVERAATFLRHVWRAYGTSAALWLFVDPARRAWHLRCPTQRCGPWHVAVDDAPASAVQLAEPHLWRVGTVRSFPSGGDSADAAAPHLPSRHGLHLLMDLSRPVTPWAAYVRDGRGITAMPLSLFVEEPPVGDDPEVATWLGRVTPDPGAG